ncbi:MAG TPA: enoyl-CoA hydratase-related protein [Euzebya sp.]|nr:enoyl-CoA hydratase-related protein [Euzebya sp.]
MTAALVALERGEVALLELRNPPMNLVTAELTTQLRAALSVLAAAPEVRAVVVAAAGDRAFCAGSDIREFAGLRGRAAEGKVLLEKLVYRQLAALPMPTIAALEHDALGGGLELALCCDIRVASVQARFGLPEVRLGVIPGSGGTQRLPRVVGPARAKDLILTGDIIDAAQAERIGLVTSVVPAGGARGKAWAVAQAIAGRGPLAVRAAKRLIDLAASTSLEEGLAVETDASIALFDSEDLAEGAAAFLAKRPPRFTGR